MSRAVALAAAGLATTLATLPAPASAQAVQLAPAGSWQVDQGEENCRLWQDFGTGTWRTTFNIYAYGPDESYRLILTSARLPRDTGRARNAQVAFGSEGEAQDVISVVSSASGNGMVSFLMAGERRGFHFIRGWSVNGEFDWNRAVLQLPTDMSRMVVEMPDQDPLSIALGDMAAPMDMLRQCQARLAQSWGLGPEALEAGARKPQPDNIDAVFDQLSMPEGMVLNHVSMIAQIRVMVDAQGHPTSCVVQHPQLERRQQRGLCRPFTSSLQMEPARDADGNAVAGVMRSVYTYFIFD